MPVLTNSKLGKCVGFLPYCVLCVQGNASNPPKHWPIWRLTENGHPSTNYRFEPTRGIDIPGAKTGGNHFDGPGHPLGDVIRYQWRPGKHKHARLNHNSFILPIGGSKDKKCSPYDPIIINTD